MRRLGIFASKPQLKRGQPRRRARPIWRQPRFWSIMFLLVGTGIGLGCLWIWKTGLFQELAGKTRWQFITGSAKYGFAVREVYVKGRIETSKELLLSTLRLKRGSPILAFDPQAALERVTALPWIRTAVIERQLPDVVYLSLVERKPLALWQHKGDFTLIDTGGEIIPLNNIGKYNNLKIVVGWNAPKHASNLLGILAVAPELAKRVKAAVRVGDRRWDIKMDNGVEVLLPELEAISAWVQLAELGMTHKFMEGRISIVDLRLPDRIVLREKLKPDPIFESKSNTIIKEYNLKLPWDT